MYLMLPYTAAAFLLLVLWCLCFPYRGEKNFTFCFENPSTLKGRKKELFLYGVLFLLSLLVVAKVLACEIALAVIVVTVFVMDRKVLKEVDYCLLLTFISFFIFTGNLGNIPVIRDTLQELVNGRELLIGVVASQAISNVPAALLLSGFTSDYRALLAGVNLGGLGTLIASMASLISYKILANKYNEKKGKYFQWFTIVNILYLIILFAFNLCI